MIELELAISPFLLLGAALPGAINLGQSLLNKPKEEDFRPNTAGMERFRAYLRGRTASSEVAHQALQPQLSAIGQQTRQTERKIQSAVGRGDLSASEEAQIQISQGQAASSVAQQAGEQAFEAQRQENRRVGQQVAQIEANIAQAKEQAKIDYERATKQHRQQVTGAALQLGAGVASAGISSHLQAVAASKSALDAGLAAGTVAAGTTAKELGAKALEAGFTSAAPYVQMLGNQQKIQQALGGFAPEELEQVLGADYDLSAVTQSGAQDVLKKLGQGRGQLARELQTKIFEGEDVDLTQYSDRLGEETLNALTTHKLNVKQSLSSPTENAITKAFIEKDEASLRDILFQTETPLKDKDRKAAESRLNSLSNARIEAKVARDKEIAEKLEVDPKDVEKMGKFTTRAIQLESKLQLDLANLKQKGLAPASTAAGQKFLDAVSQIQNKSAVAPDELKNLENLSNKWLESLDLEKAGLVSLYGTVDITDKEGISKGVGVKRSLKSEYASLIKQISDLNVILTPEQQASFQAAIDPAGLGL